MASIVIDNAISPVVSLLGSPPEVRLRIYYFVFEDAHIRIHFNPRWRWDVTHTR